MFPELPIVLSIASAHAGGAHAITPTYSGNCQSPVWSPDGSKLAYEVNYHDRKVIDLYIYEPGHGIHQVQPLERGTTSLTAGFGSGGGEKVAHDVSWGPAAVGHFVYSASTSAKDYDLFIDSGSPLAPAPGADGEPAWSPDGRWIAFTSARTGQGDLYLIDLNAVERPPRRLTSDPSSSELYAAWSPDSKKLVYVGHTRTGDNLYLIDDIEAPRPEQLTNWSRTQTHPTFSPDGRRIAFYSNHDDPDRFDLYVMELGATPYPVARGVVMNQRGPTWTPDGSHLVYVKDDDDAYDPVYVVPSDRPDRARRVATDTVGNGDLDVVRGTDGQTWLAVAAQGKTEDKVRDFKRIFVMELAVP